MNHFNWPIVNPLVTSNVAALGCSANPADDGVRAVKGCPPKRIDSVTAHMLSAKPNCKLSKLAVPVTWMNAV